MSRACPDCGPTCIECAKPVCLDVEPEAQDDATGDVTCVDHRAAVGM